MGTPGRGLPRNASVSHVPSFHPLWRPHEAPSTVEELSLRQCWGRRQRLCKPLAGENSLLPGLRVSRNLLGNWVTERPETCRSSPVAHLSSCRSPSAKATLREKPYDFEEVVGIPNPNICISILVQTPCQKLVPVSRRLARSH